MREFDRRVYWIWLQQALDYAASIYDILLYFGSAKNLYEAGENEWRSSGVFEVDLLNPKNKKLESLCAADIESAAEILEQCVQKGISVITPDDELYPQSLKRLTTLPAVLYVKGDISCLNNSLAVGVVGTRHPSDYGARAATEITKGLAENNAVVVSGGALGIDSIAHRTAIENGGKTVLVMGCGHEASYLSENKPLRDAVAENGALVTEYRPTEAAGYHTFPKRNRIISGLSQGIVVIEAGEKSGTLNTANHAKRQGRDVFAVSGDIHSKNFAGSNKLISQGARVVYSAEDIIGFYKYGKIAKNEIRKLSTGSAFEGIDKFQSYTEKTERAKTKSKRTATKQETQSHVEHKQEKISNKMPEGISKNAEIVYNIISSGKNQLDDIVRQSALPVNKVLAALTELELLGCVTLSQGNNYFIN